MEPITTTIVTALVAGAIEVVKPAATEAVKDAYGKLKSSLVKKFGKGSDVVEAIEEVEKKPESKGRLATLEEEVSAVEDQLDGEQEALAKALTQTITSYSATVSGGTVVQGEGNVVAGSGGVAVGGDVKGGINMGKKISGDYVKGDKVLGDKIGSQINTGGGNVFQGPVTAGGDVVGGNQYKSLKYGKSNVGSAYDALFDNLQSTVAEQAPAMSGKVTVLKAQVTLGARADDEEMANLIQDIVDAAPGTQAIIVDLFSHPEVSTAVGPTTRFVLKRLS